MTWTDADTEALRALEPMAFVEDPSCADYTRRAADEIERLRSALSAIATGSAWNPRETARHALGDEAR